MEFFRWGKKNNPLSWIRISTKKSSILINTKLNRDKTLESSDLLFLEALASGKEWPDKNVKQYPKQTLQKFLEISKIS